MEKMILIINGLFDMNQIMLFEHIEDQLEIWTWTLNDFDEMYILHFFTKSWWTIIQIYWNHTNFNES